VSPSVPAKQRPRVLDEALAGIGLVLLTMAVIGLRSEIVRIFPRTASIYAALGLPVNLRGLQLEHFHTVTTGAGFRTTLGIEGEIENLRSHMVQIPPIELAIRDAQGRILYSWQVPAPKQRLGPHESFAFRAKLAAPPAGGKDVLIRFAPRPSFTLAEIWRKVGGHL